MFNKSKIIKPLEVQVNDRKRNTEEKTKLPFVINKSFNKSGISFIEFTSFGTISNLVVNQQLT